MGTTRTGKVTIIATCSIAVFLSFMTMALAKEGMGKMREGKHEKLMAYLLELDNEQIKAIKAIKQSYKEQMTEARENVHFARQSFRQSVENDVAEDSIRIAFEPVADALEEVAVLRTLMKQEMKQVLTAEQIEKADELHNEVFSKMRPNNLPVNEETEVE